MRFLVAVVSVVLVAGCATTDTSYLAKVNGEAITGADLRREFARRHAALDKYLLKEEDTRKVLGRAIDRRLMVQEGYRMQLQETPAVRERVAAFRARKAGEALVRDEVDAKSVPSDEEMHAAHTAMGQVNIIRQLVVKTREEAERLHAELAGGAHMEAMVRSRSIAPTAKRGGLMRLEWGGPDVARERIAWALQEGGTSEVFQSGDGWEVVRLEKRIVGKPEELPVFEVVESRIRGVLKERKRKAREDEVIGRLWLKYGAKLVECAPKIEVLEAAKRTPDLAACAEWSVGRLTVSDVAGRVDLARLREAGEEQYRPFLDFMIDDLVNREVLGIEALALGYGDRPEIVEAVRVHEQELVERKLYDDYVMKGVSVTDDDVKAAYEARRAEYMTEPQYVLAQIVVPTEAVAKEVQAKLGAEKFEDLAKAYSIDPRSAEEGGIGTVPKSKLAEEFAPVAALAEGQVSAPIRSSVGFHFVKVLRIEPARQKTFDEAKRELGAKLLDEKRQAAIERWVKPIRKEASISLNDAGIRVFTAEQKATLAKEEADRQAEADRKAAAVKAAEEAAAKEAAAKEAAAKEAAAKEAAAGNGTPATAPDPAPAPAPAPTPIGQGTSAGSAAGTPPTEKAKAASAKPAPPKR